MKSPTSKPASKREKNSQGDRSWLHVLLGAWLVMLVACQPLNAAPAPSTKHDATRLVAEATPVTIPNPRDILPATRTPLPSPPPTLTPTPTLRPGSLGPDAYPPDVNPLTGLRVSDPAALNRRPIIAKISNSPALVRPQAGIGQADLVFEHYTEAGITRFSALFYAQAPQRVGSIRSARLIDYELVPMYQGLLAFAGASIGVDKRIYGSQAVADFYCQHREDRAQCEREANLIGPPGFIPPSEFADRAYKGVFYGPPYYWRDESLPVPHNFFVNVAALWELAAADGHAQRPDLRGMVFHPEPDPEPTGGGTWAEIRYETTLVNWHYDPASGRYWRSTDGQPHFDANLNQQVSAANLIIVEAGHYLTDIVESGSGANVHWSAQITIWPEGEVIVLRDGRRYEGRWLRPSRPELMTFERADGAPIALKPGNSWVQLVRPPQQRNPEREWINID